MLVALAGFVLVLASVLLNGWPDLTWHFLSSWPDAAAGGDGILPELINTTVMVGLALVITAPLGLMVAVYQTEYRQRRRPPLERVRGTWLAAPTIVIGLVVYRVAVGWFHWPISLLTGTLALAVINWPFMVSISESALGGVPASYRQASLALGASRFETVVRVVIPAAAAPLIEGLGMAAARMAGESAALIVTAGINVSRHWGLLAPGETLAVHIWYLRTEGLAAGRDAASAATGVVLLTLVTVVLWISRRIARWFE
ncbi:ABC transporter permease subunit [Sulfobacillus sp. DSM 109850]|uniref:ABC transporter permease subunit n=2 Tax=Sulfobacillus harzensis TaxID=2729629 RepID=A0A7Y0L4A3_9FIRM|nr:ABC transporter permease subunit [Sulfobacillus harzensis]